MLARHDADQYLQAHVLATPRAGGDGLGIRHGVNAVDVRRGAGHRQYEDERQADEHQQESTTETESQIVKN